MSNPGNSANYPPQPSNDSFVDPDPDMRLNYPGINDDHMLDIAPDPRRHDRNWLLRAGGSVIGAAKHWLHERAEDVHETWDESTAGFRGQGYYHSRDSQHHLKHQHEKEARGEFSTGYTAYASPDQRAGDSTLKALLSRQFRSEREQLDTIRSYIYGDYYKRGAHGEASISDRHPEWRGHTDLRNIQLLRDTFRGIPDGDTRGLTPSQLKRVKAREDSFAGGFRALGLSIRRAYLGIDPDRVTNRGGFKSDYIFEFGEAIGVIDRALRAAQSAPALFNKLAAQTSRSQNILDDGIRANMTEWNRRDRAGVYSVPADFNYDGRTDPINRIRELEGYLHNFDSHIHGHDADQDIATPFRDELEALINARRARQARQSQPRGQGR